MSSEIKADKWSPASGTSATIGDSGDTFTVPSGVTLDTSSSTLTLPSSAITGQTAITSLADTDKFLVSDASDSGNLKYVEKQYLGGGAWVRLGGTDATGLSDITYDLFSSTYEVYRIIGSHTMSSDDTETRLRIRKSGSDQTSSHYRWAYNQATRTSSSGADGENSAWNADHIRLTNGSSNATAHPTAIDFTIFSPTSSTRQSAGLLNSAFFKPASTNAWTAWNGSMWFDSTTGLDIDGVKIYPSTGTLVNALYSIYALKDS